MFLAKVQNVVAERFLQLAKRGVDTSLDAQLWGSEIERLQNLFGSGFPDYYLYTIWKTPFELHFLSRSQFSYYEERRTCFSGVYSSSLVTHVDEKDIRRRLTNLDVILYKLTLFAPPKRTSNEKT